MPNKLSYPVTACKMMNQPPATNSLQEMLEQIHRCDHCAEHLPLGANPVVQASASAKLLIVGQAPGSKVHQTGIPFNDPSGDRLREWMGVNREQFYDSALIAILPMGFCYPGKGRSGDMPPRPECAPMWHNKVLKQLRQLKLVLLVGQYAQQYYLGEKPATLTETVRNWRSFLPRYFVLPHPSPRNQIWLKRNPWFESEVLPPLRAQVRQHLSE